MSKSGLIGIAMNKKEFFDEALKLKPKERVLLIESIIKSPDQPEKELNEIWVEESEKRAFTSDPK